MQVDSLVFIVLFLTSLALCAWSWLNQRDAKRILDNSDFIRREASALLKRATQGSGGAPSLEDLANLARAYRVWQLAFCNNGGARANSSTYPTITSRIEVLARADFESCTQKVCSGKPTGGLEHVTHGLRAMYGAGAEEAITVYEAMRKADDATQARLAGEPTDEFPAQVLQ